MENQSILICDKMSFKYESELASPLVFEDISLKIEPGEFTAILGHNGSGKSTLAKHFNAILLPTGGKMFVLGMDTTDEELVYKIRQNVGMVFQNPDNQIVANIVEEDVAFAPENLGVPPREIRQRVDDALKKVGMQDYRDQAPNKLSGGQKQRIAIAGVIAMMPRCIVLDEPTAMLDPVGRKEVLRTIRMLNREYGITIVLITHHMEEAALCDRIIVLGNGQIITDGPPKQVFCQVELLKGIGLDVPQTVEFLYTLRKAGMDLPLDALTIDECAEAVKNHFKDGGAFRNGSNFTD